MASVRSQEVCVSLPDDLKSLDVAMALGRVGGDEELLKEITLIFIEQCPGALAEIRAAAEAADAEALERSAHALKGSVANFGAESARAAAYEIEEMGRSRNLEGVGRALKDLDQALAILISELRRLIAD